MGAQAQMVRSTTEEESLQLTRNLFRIAIFNITFIRGLFPDDYFEDKFIDDLGMKVQKLCPRDVESRRLIDWMEKGVYDALQKKYLRLLQFGICSGEGGRVIEEYDFSFSYPNEAVEMNIAKKVGTSQRGKSFKTHDVNAMRSSARKMVRMLVQLMRTLDHVPEERTIVMKLFYYDEVTPKDYEPPFFRGCTGEDNMQWLKHPLKIKVGKVDSRHYCVSLKLRSTLDGGESAEKENGEEVSFTTTSSPTDDNSEDDDDTAADDDATSPVKDVDDDADTLEKDIERQVISVTRMQIDDDDDDENTQDTETEEANFRSLKEWVLSRISPKLEMCDVLSHFPDVSVSQTEELMARLVKEGVLKLISRDVYHKQQKVSPAPPVADVVVVTPQTPQLQNEERLYLEALYHTLQMEHVTFAALQNKLKCSQYSVKKLISKMVNEGFIEDVASNRKNGRRVLHSKATEAKLKEVDKHLKGRAGDAQVPEMQSLATCTSKKMEEDEDDGGSTMAGCHTTGSDVTRYEQSAATSSKRPAPAQPAPATKTEPAVSRESTVATKDIPSGQWAMSFWTQPSQTQATTTNFNDSQETNPEPLDLDKLKASMVQEPIYQSAKRSRIG